MWNYYVSKIELETDAGEFSCEEDAIENARMHLKEIIEFDASIIIDMAKITTRPAIEEEIQQKKNLLD